MVQFLSALKEKNNSFNFTASLKKFTVRIIRIG
jgi:hypothetical protein